MRIYVASVLDKIASERDEQNLKRAEDQQLLSELQTQYQKVEGLPAKVQQDSPGLEKSLKTGQKFLTDLNNYIGERTKELETAKKG